MEDFFHFEPPRTLLKQLTEIKIIFLVLLSAFIFLPTMSASSTSENFHISTWIPNIRSSTKVDEGLVFEIVVKLQISIN